MSSYYTKRRYVVYSCVFLLYLGCGIIFRQIYRRIKFTFAEYNTLYIDHYSEKQMELNDKPTKREFYKLYNNAPYSMTIGNVALRLNIKLLSDF